MGGGRGDKFLMKSLETSINIGYEMGNYFVDSGWPPTPENLEILQKDGGFGN